MAIVLGLVSAFGWGTAYFAVRLVMRHTDSTRGIFYADMLGFLLLTAYLVFTGGFAGAFDVANRGAWGLLVLASFLNTLAIVLDWRAIKIGMLSVVTPIVANYSVVTALLAVASGSSLTAVQMLGIGVAAVGVGLTTPGTFGWRRPRMRLGSLKSLQEATTRMFDANTEESGDFVGGLVLALLTATAYGIAYWAIGTFASPTLGGVIPAWLVRMNTMLLVAAATVNRSGVGMLSMPVRGAWLWIVLVSVLSLTALVSSFIGFTRGNVAIVTMLASLYSAVTVLLAATFLHERLRLHQWFGVGVIILGVVLVSL